MSRQAAKAAAALLTLLCILAGHALATEPTPRPGVIQIRYRFSGDYVGTLCAALYKKTHDPKYLPPEAPPGYAVLWEPHPSELIEGYTGIKRPEGAQIYPIASLGILIVQGDVAWRTFIIKLHNELGIPLHRQ